MATITDGRVCMVDAIVGGRNVMTAGFVIVIFVIIVARVDVFAL